MANMQRGGHMGNFRGKRDSSDMDRKFQYRFLIPNKAAAIINGKLGERIQRLRNECNSRLSIPDSKSPERVFIIDGSFENIVKIWSDLFPDLKVVMGQKNGEEMDLRFLCHNSIVGAIIGKGGNRVKELRGTYQLSLIKVHAESAPKSSDRVIQVIGAPDKLFACLQVMFSDLENQNVRGAVDNYNPDNFDEGLCSSYGGWRGEPGCQYGATSSIGQGDASIGYDQSPMDPYGCGPPSMNNPYAGPPMNSYDTNRGIPPPMNQYGPGQGVGQVGEAYDSVRSGGPPMNQYGTGRTVPPPINPYDSDRGVAPQYGSRGSIDETMDPYDTGTSFNQYDTARSNAPPQMNQYGSNRPPGPSLKDVYGPPAVNQYGPGASAATAMNPYGQGRNVPPAMDDYDDDMNVAPPPMNQYGSRPPVDQYGATNRNNAAIMNDYGQAANQYGSGRGQYDGPRGPPALGGAIGRGGNVPGRPMNPGIRNVIDPSGRTIIPLMDQCDFQDDYYKCQGNTDSRNVRGMRRPFPEERPVRPGMAKKPRSWGNGNEENNGPQGNYGKPVVAVATPNAVIADNVDIIIPTTYFAALRGVDGEKLSNMMRDSGAEIVVTPDTDGGKSGQRVLNVRGTKDQIEGAQYLMQMCMKRCMLNLTHG